MSKIWRTGALWFLVWGWPRSLVDPLAKPQGLLPVEMATLVEPSRPLSISPKNFATLVLVDDGRSPASVSNTAVQHSKALMNPTHSSTKLAKSAAKFSNTSIRSSNSDRGTTWSTPAYRLQLQGKAKAERLPLRIVNLNNEHMATIFRVPSGYQTDFLMLEKGLNTILIDWGDHQEEVPIYSQNQEESAESP